MNGRDAEIARALKTPQIITLALITGLITFGAVAPLIGEPRTPDPNTQRVLVVVLCLFPPAELAAYIVVRRSLVERLRQAHAGKSATEELALALMPPLTALTVIAAALAEGFGLLGLVAFVITGSAPMLAAPAVALIALALAFPTRPKLARLVSDITGQPWQ